MRTLLAIFIILSVIFGTIALCFGQEQKSMGQRAAEAEWRLQQVDIKTTMIMKIVRELYLEKHKEADYEKLFFIEEEKPE